MFTATVPLGRIRGVRIGAHWSVLIIVGLIAYLLATSLLPTAVPGYAAGWYWFTAAVTSVLFMASLLAHEVSHSITARHYGVPTKRITLWMLGGAAELEKEPPHPRADFLIAFAGPATSLLVGGACWGLAALVQELVPPLAFAALLWLGLTNVVIAVFNLLPGAPLDGGRLVRSAVWKRTGDRRRAARAAARAGQVLGALLLVAGFVEVLGFGQFSGLWLALIGWFLIGAAAAELRHSQLHQRLGGMPVREVMTRHPEVAPGWWTVESFLERIADHGRHRVFPVVSFEGAPLGVVSLAELVRLSADERMTSRVADVCRTPPAVPIVPADTPVEEVLASTPLRAGRDLLLVTEYADNSQKTGLAGVVSPDDLGRTVELAALREDAATRSGEPGRGSATGADANGEPRHARTRRQGAR
ncbi:Zn-dependent protease [Saccharomonospora marina XMU15]|uniref:Zinc metalloprotease n=1 Tax=Saccharomonospora marina XMU15 TaxID=882083 RepID=H5X2N5_9PSEU|nr:site-2 protease family protein [Saccharomonospora marina]EHR50974.1 Zn-dependent protease [Saccharomonospora marina XMU15]